MKFEPIINWSGSKRALSEQIINKFPSKIDTYYEPFCGGCSILFQLLNSNININKYVCSDINKELIDFFNIVKSNPIKIYDEYFVRWSKLTAFNSIPDKQKYYNEIRLNYNTTKNIFDFIFLSRTSVNGLIRYNSKGDFNSSFHLTRNGINPDRFKKILFIWSEKLNENNVIFLNCDYRNIVPNKNDYLFLDSPYANTTGMYFGTIDLNEYWNYLRNIKCCYSFTFDGKSTINNNTYSVPTDLYTNHIYLDSKISGFQKLHKTIDYVKESLYLKE